MLNFNHTQQKRINTTDNDFLQQFTHNVKQLFDDEICFILNTNLEIIYISKLRKYIWGLP